ncbi:MFS transporter [Niveispirillum sp. KHB5.9]|uniref:MFS transporter n=1 Tax=Niveispirillum sp. KHB5.9 TaxID=3400269 RepID=UPI003A86FAAF
MTACAINGKSLLRYGFIALPVAFAGFPLYVLAPDLYATRHGLSLTLLGTLLLAIRLVDAVQDPVIGWLTDRLRGRFNRLVTAAGLVLCVSVLGLFNGPFLTPALWFTLCMVVAVSAYSVLTIVLGAQATLWTADRDDQTRIAGAREGFGLVGLVVAVSMPAILSQFTKPDHAYWWYGAILTILMLAGIAGFSKVSARVAASVPVIGNGGASPFQALRTLPRESRRLLAVYGLGMLASSIPAVLVIFYVRDRLDAEHLTGPFLLLYFLSGAMTMPLWRHLTGHVGKYGAWALSHLLAVAGLLGAFFLGSGDIWGYAAVCALSGLALGADLTLPPSILADHVHDRGNQAFSATHYAFLAFISKASLALASAIALPVLDIAGFQPKAANSGNALMALSATYALLPCLLKLMAAGLLYVFFIRAETGGHDENRQDHSNRGGCSHD